MQDENVPGDKPQNEPQSQEAQVPETDTDRHQ